MTLPPVIKLLKSSLAKQLNKYTETQNTETQIHRNTETQIHRYTKINNKLQATLNV